MKNAKLTLRGIFLVLTALAVMTVTGCKQPVKENKGSEVKTYAVTVTPPANGRITVSKSSTLLTGEELKAVKENSELVITLSANDGYKTEKLVIDGVAETHSADGGKTISKTVKVTKALTVSGGVVKESTPAKTYAVTVTPPANGKISVKKGGAVLTSEALKAVEENSELVITLSADDGYKTEKLVIDGVAETHSADGGKTISKTVKVTKTLTVSGGVSKMPTEKDGFVEIVPPQGGITGADPSYSIPEDRDWGKGVFRKDRTVELSPYSIGKYEVTYKLWKEVYDWAKSNGYIFTAAGQKGGSADASYNEAKHTDDEPVTKVSWRDCIVWCNAYTHMKNKSEAECVYLKEKAGGAPLKNAEERITITTEDDTIELNACDLAYADRSKKGFRLPTEAEWEFAARYQGSGSDSLDKTNAEKYGSIYLTKLDSASGAKLPVPAQNVTVPSGKTYEDLKNELDRVAVFGKYWNGSKLVVHNTAGTTMAAGKKAPNELGLYDMTGNVWEWCFDWDSAIEKGNVKDPQGPDIYSIGSFNRVVRGGNWDNLPQICTVGRRIDSMPESAAGYLGFRLASGASVFPAPAPEQFTVTFAQPENGSLSAVIKGTATTVESDSKHPKGTEIRFTAVPAAGFRVKGWTPADEIKLVSTDSKTVGDLVLEKDTAVTVAFEPLPKFKVTFSLDGTGGTGTITARKGTAPNQTEIQSGDFVTVGERIEFEVTGYDTNTLIPAWTVTGIFSKPKVLKNAKLKKIHFTGAQTAKATAVDVKLKLETK